MREIKFNAWNKATNTMLSDILSTDNWSFSFFNKDVFIWLQYAGLKDNNGKEIYEGDIVKWGHTHTGGMGHEEPVRVAEVKINPDIQFEIIDPDPNRKYFFGQDKIFRYGSFIYTDTEKYLEVIGNIYENTELLIAKTKHHDKL